MKKPPIVCNATAAGEAMKQRYERHAALVRHIRQGLQGGIAAHNGDEQGRGFPPTTVAEIQAAIVEVLMDGAVPLHRRRS